MDLLLPQPAAAALARRDLLVLIAAACAFLAYRIWVARQRAPSAAVPNATAQHSEKTLQKDVARDRAPGG